MVSSFVCDSLEKQADALLLRAPIIVSAWARVEFSSAISRLVRTSHLSAPDAQRTLAQFDQWCASQKLEPTETADFNAADGFVRDPFSGLRGPDALHIACCQRLRAQLVSLDAKLTAAASVLGVSVMT